MKYIKQLFWLFLFSFLGELLSLVSPIAIPGSVVGMVLLFVALHFNWLKLEKVDEVSTWLTDNMAIFFVPAGVGLMTNFDILAGIWWQLLLIVLVSMSVMILVVGYVVQTLKRRKEDKEVKKANEVSQNV